MVAVVGSVDTPGGSAIGPSVGIDEPGTVVDMAVMPAVVVVVAVVLAADVVVTMESPGGRPDWPPHAPATSTRQTVQTAADRHPSNSICRW